MSTKNAQPKPLRSNDRLPKAGPKSPNGGRNQRRTGQTGTSGPTGFFQGLQKERQEAARAAFIEKLDSTVMNARLIADGLVSGRAREIVEYMITAYYLLSQKSANNVAVPFVDAKQATLKDIGALGHDTKGFLNFTTSQGFSALRGGLELSRSNEMTVDDIVANIKKENEEYRNRVKELASV